MDIYIYFCLPVSYQGGGKATTIFWPFGLSQLMWSKWSKKIDHDHGHNSIISMVIWSIQSWPWPCQNSTIFVVKMVTSKLTMTIAIIRKFPWSYGQSKVDYDHDQNSTIFVVKIVTPKLAIRLQGEHFHAIFKLSR